MDEILFAGQTESLPRLRVALIDSDLVSHTLLTETLRQLAPTWSVESYLSPFAAVKRIAASQPSVVLVDACAAENPELVLVRQLRAQTEDLPVVVLAKQTTATAIFYALMAGASGFLIKPVSSSEIVPALLEVAFGAIVLCQRSRMVLAAHLQKMDRAATSRHLTFREKEMLISFGEGKSPKDIATDLGVATDTVRVHVRNMYRKLQVHDRQEALRKFLGMDAME